MSSAGCRAGNAVDDMLREYVEIVVDVRLKLGGPYDYNSGLGVLVDLWSMVYFKTNRDEVMRRSVEDVCRHSPSPLDRPRANLHCLGKPSVAAFSIVESHRNRVCFTYPCDIPIL